MVLLLTVWELDTDNTATTAIVTATAIYILVDNVCSLILVAVVVVW